MIFIHVAIALASIAAATYLVFSPDRKLVVVSYGLIAATIASGVMLVVIQPTALLHACVTGLIYTSIVTVLSVRTHLALQREI